MVEALSKLPELTPLHELGRETGGIRVEAAKVLRPIDLSRS
jgi:hypothetical protein